MILGLSEPEMYNILTLYKEFLRQVNFDFQILTLNSKLNVNEYIELLSFKNNVWLRENMHFNNELKIKYLEDIKSKLEKENIYESKYYIIVSTTYNSSFTVDFVDNVIKKLDKIGCKTNKIYGRENIKRIVQNCIKK